MQLEDIRPPLESDNEHGIELFRKLEEIVQESIKSDMSSIVMVWSFLYYSNRLNYRMAGDRDAATSIALQVMSSALDASREEGGVIYSEESPHLH
jgi:hypothetical protein